MNSKEFAALLNGREYGSEITEAEEAQAKAASLVVVFGYSDDNVELRGAINEEIGAYEGTTFRIGKAGLVPSFDSLDHDDEEAMEAYFTAKGLPYYEIEAVWAKEDGYSWTYRTDMPHETFEIVEDGEPFCRGIVFAHPT